MKNVKRILIVVLMILCIVVSSYATATILQANQVSYNNTTVDAALQDLYNKVTEAQVYKTKIEEDKNMLIAAGVTLFSTTKTGVGKYADVDGNGTVDGIIYADLVFNSTPDAYWGNNDGNFSYTAITSGLKNYAVSQTNYNGAFGPADVLVPKGSGTDRFYVMALRDFSAGYWYYSAYGKMDDYSTYTSANFGTGKANTAAMINKWNVGGYGEKDAKGTGTDLWGMIGTEVSKGWFLPSRGEWAAFACNLKITSENYDSFGLSDYYSSSSQSTNEVYWQPWFTQGRFSNANTQFRDGIRLSATF